MSSFSQLQERVRRSSSFNNPNIFDDLLQYSSQCQDEIEVLRYMEQHQIGVDEPVFWLRMLEVLRQMCQLQEINKLLIRLKQNHLIREHPQFKHIREFQSDLMKEIQREIRIKRGKRNKQRRSYREFQLLEVNDIPKKTRKIGGLEIYVDQQCRDNYKLEDYSQFFLKQMKDQVQRKRSAYKRKQTPKQLSFLGQKQFDLNQWFKEVIDGKKIISLISHNSRNSNVHNIFLNSKEKQNQNRFSLNRKSNLGLRNNPESVYNTPVISKNQRSKENNSLQSNLIQKTPINQKLPSSKSFKTPVHEGRRLKENHSLMKALKKSTTIKHILKNKDLDSYLRNNDNFKLSKSFNDQNQGLDQFDDDIIEFDGMEIIRANADDQEIYNQKILQNNHQNDHDEPQHSYLKKKPIKDQLDYGMVEEESQQQGNPFFQIEDELLNTIHNTQLETFDNFSSRKSLESDYFPFKQENRKDNLQIRQYCSLQDEQFLSGREFASSSEIQPSESIEDSQAAFFCSNQSIDTQCKQSLMYNSKTIGIKSSKTFESLDSDAQNMFSSRKPWQPQQIQPVFRRKRYPFQQLTQQELVNGYSQTITDGTLEFDDECQIQSNSIQGNNYIQEMINEISRNEIHPSAQHNVVLQTLRKNNILNQIKQIRRENELSGTISERKDVFRRLSHITEEKSYHTETKFSSKERFGFRNDKDYNF